ncbi:PREDICTED: probable 2-oxoglutarate-dependent dioxygenase AOP1.2 [Erythranthe guttata]|nr:PREDICTED: probable 2-oxoglutarate-dependent dioxygenase AOP1.2 [Erythranthe guttata]|eukprot:XP_012856134.1 PREDICTED: probable 2-oxoglutarate-dependent dioxygenase AOP1.2 [Erythranthe guttata]
MGSLTIPELLVVDFTKEEMKPGSISWSTSCKEIRRALENHGCFVALYDKISTHLHKSIFKAADELFDLPTEVKIQNKNDKPYHGYVGQMPIVPLHEGLGIDYSTTLEGAQGFTNLMWPNGNDSFCETSRTFAKTVAELEKLVIKMLFESYGPQHFESHIELLTLLIIFYCLVINEAWSNNKVLSPNHKVTLHKNGIKETRYTIALFSFLSKMVKVPEEFVDDDENPLQFKPFVHVDLLKFYDTDHGRRSQNILKDFCGV